jgi:hypothetical protein
MSDSAMVIMWPSGSPDADGSYASVTLSQRKAPYETMPLPDPSPPFVAALELSGTSVRLPCRRHLTFFLALMLDAYGRWALIGYGGGTTDGFHSSCE